jgi:hypothetical protein
MVLVQRVSQSARMSDWREKETPNDLCVVWSDDFRTCTARIDAAGSVVQVVFASQEPVLCTMARMRMETAAAAAVRSVIEP